MHFPKIATAASASVLYGLHGLIVVNPFLRRASEGDGRTNANGYHFYKPFSRHLLKLKRIAPSENCSVCSELGSDVVVVVDYPLTTFILSMLRRFWAALCRVDWGSIAFQRRIRPKDCIQGMNAWGTE